MVSLMVGWEGGQAEGTWAGVAHGRWAGSQWAGVTHGWGGADRG